MKFSSFPILKLNSFHSPLQFFSSPCLNILPRRWSIRWLSNTCRFSSVWRKRLRATHVACRRQFPSLFSIRRSRREVFRNRSPRLWGKFLGFLYFCCCETFKGVFYIWWSFWFVNRLGRCEAWFSLRFWARFTTWKTKRKVSDMSYLLTVICLCLFWLCRGFFLSIRILVLNGLYSKPQICFGGYNKTDHERTQNFSETGKCFVCSGSAFSA